MLVKSFPWYVNMNKFLLFHSIVNTLNIYIMNYEVNTNYHIYSIKKNRHIQDTVIRCVTKSK